MVDRSSPVTAELLPCPFCGGKPIWQYNQGGQANNFEELRRLNCSECYRIDMPYWSQDIDCIKQWNARTPDRSSAGIEEINQIVEQAEWYASVDANAGLAFYLAKHWPQIRAATYRDPAQAAPDRAAIIEECANAVVFCGECDCPAMSKKAILALSITSTDRQNMVASDPSPEKIDPKPEPLL